MVKESSKDRDRDRSDRNISSSNRTRMKETTSRREISQIVSSTTKKLRTENDREKSKPEIPVSVSSSSSKGKTSTPHGDRDSPSTVQSKPIVEEKTFSIGKKELYDSVVDWKGSKAKNLQIDKELDSYVKACKSLEDIMAAIYEIKTSEKPDTDAIENLKTDGLMILMELRRRNRFMKLKQKSVKEEGLSLRHDVDYHHLLLQNLLYESTHLTKQVAAVQDYKGADAKIDLIPVEQFYTEAPASITKEDKTREDPHLLRIARLEYEYMQRQKLTEQITALEKEKETVAKTIDDEERKLSNLRPMLAKTLESTVPLQEFFGINTSARKQQYQKSQHLPAPLYVMFVQSIAYQDAQDGPTNFTINICGDAESVKDIVVTPEDEEPDDDSDSDKDQEDNFEAEEASKRRPLRKRSSFIQSLEDRRKKVVQKHPLRDPLWIEWIIKAKEGESITIQFFFLVKLKIVAVKCKVDVDLSTSRSSDSAMRSDNILANLFSNDFGDESPNPSNVISLQAVDIENFSDVLPEVGRPFKWAQKLAGLEFPCLYPCLDSEEAKIAQKESVGAITVAKTLKIVRKRLSSQKKLWMQVKSLEMRSYRIPEGAKEHFPSKNSSSIRVWEEIDWCQYRSFEFAQNFINLEIVGEKNYFYKCVIERGRAKITALVSLSLDFPKVAPVVCIQLDQDGEERNAGNDSSIRDIEKELNVYALDDFAEWADSMVTLQLHRLLYCTDVLLETDFVLGESTGPSEFAREKMIMNPAKGRNLRRPFRYVSGSGYFVQRY